MVPGPPRTLLAGGGGGERAYACHSEQVTGYAQERGEQMSSFRGQWDKTQAALEVQCSSRFRHRVMIQNHRK